MNSFSFVKLSSVSCEENSIFLVPWDLKVKDFLIMKNQNQALLSQRFKMVSQQEN